MNKLRLIDKINIWRRKMRWNKQYQKGKWDYLNNDTEEVRYIQIIDFIKKHGIENPTILDLGCGEGILNEKLSTYNYNHILGVDYSKVSIKNANNKNIPKSKFIVADLHDYEPKGMFDIIIFNEAFYYIHESVRAKVLKVMLKHLKQDGILISSIYKEGTGCWEYFDIDELQKLDFVTVNSKKPDTYWKTGVYKKL